MGYFPQYIRPDEERARGAALTATSFQVGYEPQKAANGEPSEPWWATGASGTLTLTLAGSYAIDAVALIHSNVDNGRDITIGGDLAGTIQGKRTKGGYYPINVAFNAGGALADTITIAIAGNSLNVAIGQVACGPLRALSMPFLVGSDRDRVRATIEDMNPDWGHTIVHDLGAEKRIIQPRMIHDPDSLDELTELWEYTKGGTIPFLLFPRGIDHPEPPAWVRMARSFAFQHQQGHTTASYVFEEVSRGIMVA